MQELANFWVGIKLAAGMFMRVAPLLLVVFLVASVIGKIISAIAPKDLSQTAKKILPVMVLALSFIGLTQGVAASASRDPSALGLIFPALLSLQGALLGYAMTKESLKEIRPVIPSGLIALAVASLSGAFIGGAVRSSHEEYEKGYKAWWAWEEVRIAAHKERLMQEEALRAEMQRIRTLAQHPSHLIMLRALQYEPRPPKRAEGEAGK